MRSGSAHRLVALAHAREAQQLGVERCDSLDDLFRQADIVTLHLALKPDTRSSSMRPSRPAQTQRHSHQHRARRGGGPGGVAGCAPGGKLRAGLDVFDPEPAEATADFNDPILHLSNLYGTHHIGASTEQAQEAIAEEAVRIIQTFVQTGVVLNCVNLATRTPAKWQLVVRHYDRVGVLPLSWTRFAGRALTSRSPERDLRGRGGGQLPHPAQCRAGGELLASIKAGNADIMGSSYCGWVMGCLPIVRARGRW